MDNLHFNEEIIKNKHLKSFIRVGSTFIDIKQTLGFSFIKDPDGYIIVQFVYESGRALNAFLKNRDEFLQFLLELDPFIDDNISLDSITKFAEKIEFECKVNKYKKRRKNNIKNEQT